MASSPKFYTSRPVKQFSVNSVKHRIIHSRIELPRKQIWCCRYDCIVRLGENSGLRGARFAPVDVCKLVVHNCLNDLLIFGAHQNSVNEHLVRLIGITKIGGNAGMTCDKVNDILGVLLRKTPPMRTRKGPQPGRKTARQAEPQSKKQVEQAVLWRV